MRYPGRVASQRAEPHGKRAEHGEEERRSHDRGQRVRVTSVRLTWWLLTIACAAKKETSVDPSISTKVTEQKTVSKFNEHGHTVSRKDRFARLSGRSRAPRVWQGIDQGVQTCPRASQLLIRSRHG